MPVAPPGPALALFHWSKRPAAGDIGRAALLAAAPGAPALPGAADLRRVLRAARSRMGGGDALYLFRSGSSGSMLNLGPAGGVPD